MGGWVGGWGGGGRIGPSCYVSIEPWDKQRPTNNVDSTTQ